jgi:hypothetical protein
MTSARPPDSRSSVAKSWKTRTGSSELRTGAENGDGARQPNALGSRRGGGQWHDRRRDGEVGAVVLADAEHVEADLVGQLDFLDQVTQAPLGSDARVHVGEGVEPQLHERAV